MVDFSRFTHVMDVGGGYGTVLAAILAANRELCGSVLELPYLEHDTLAFLARHQSHDREWRHAIEIGRRGKHAFRRQLREHVVAVSSGA